MSYERCPGCGDKGDHAHIVACTSATIEMLRKRLRGISDDEYVNGFRDGVEWFADNAELQRKRRGMVSIAELRNVGRRIYRSNGKRGIS